MYIHPILWQGNIEKWCTTGPQKISALMEMPPPNTKKELQAFLSIINYLGKFSLLTAAVCEPIHKLTSSKAVWSWDAPYQAIYEKVKWFIKADACMKFYNENRPLYLETDASRIGFGAMLLQMRYCTWQHSSLTHCICQQKPHQCRVQVQQYRKWGTGHITWSGKVSSLLLC